MKLLSDRCDTLAKSQDVEKVLKKIQEYVKYDEFRQLDKQMESCNLVYREEFERLYEQIRF